MGHPIFIYILPAEVGNFTLLFVDHLHHWTSLRCSNFTTLRKYTYPDFFFGKKIWNKRPKNLIIFYRKYFSGQNINVGIFVHPRNVLLFNAICLFIYYYSHLFRCNRVQSVAFLSSEITCLKNNWLSITTSTANLCTVWFPMLIFLFISMKNYVPELKSGMKFIRGWNRINYISFNTIITSIPQCSK